MHLLNIHIPKTAGTSLKKGLENYFGKHNMLYDYGENSIHTSKVISKYIYKNNDAYELYNLIQKKDKSCLSGHFQGYKYCSLFKTENTITIMRNPVHQVISHYNHHINILNSDLELDKFITHKHYRDIQHGYLSSREIELYGFIGIQERYLESIEMLNLQFGLELPVLQLNTSKPHATSETILTDELTDFIIKHNQKDEQLYNKAMKLFDEKLRILKANKEYTFCSIRNFDLKKIDGWAYKSYNDKPVTIDIFVNDFLEASIRCTEPRPGLQSFSIPRKAFVGFSYYFKKPLTEADKVICKVSDTGQQVFI